MIIQNGFAGLQLSVMQKKDNWIIIMPDGGKSYYTNCIRGDKYWDYMAKELPEIVYTLFPYVSKKREDHYVAGLSMGGYGSMKLALNYPDSFKAAASFSGALNLKKGDNGLPRKLKMFIKMLLNHGNR